MPMAPLHSQKEDTTALPTFTFKKAKSKTADLLE
jgi:hypothetical protein